MKVLRDPQIISGFIYEDPLKEIKALTHCGEAVCIRGHELPVHSHRGFEFLYLSRGTVTWRVGRDLIRQKMGDMIITYPGESHGSGTKTSEESHHLWIGLDLESLGAEGRIFARHLRKRKLRLLSGCTDTEPILRAIVGQVVTHRPHRMEVMRAYIRTLFAIINQQSQKPSDQRKERGRIVLPYSYAIQRSVSYMERNLDRRLLLADLASVAAMKQISHFCTQFRREVGIPPAAYHLQLRLNAARSALLQPALPVTTVALQFGFSSSQHFSTMFQRSFGVSPRAWRRS